MAGWQGEHDANTATFAHRSFALSRQSAAEAGALARGDNLHWPDYAGPMLAAATQSRAVHQAQGRALVLERFLAHMRADPDTAATEAWFDRQTAEILAAADGAGAETAALADSIAELTVSEDAFRRIAAAAAREGRIRGEALQLGDLGRTAADYFRRTGYDERTLAFDRGAANAPAPDERLVAAVESRLGWAALSTAIVRPRTCSRADTGVSCVPAPLGAAPEAPAAEPPVAEALDEHSVIPGEDVRRTSRRVRAPDLLERRPGW